MVQETDASYLDYYSGDIDGEQGVEFWMSFLTALLKYNLRAIQFTPLSCIM